MLSYANRVLFLAILELAFTSANRATCIVHVKRAENRPLTSSLHRKVLFADAHLRNGRILKVFLARSYEQNPFRKFEHRFIGCSFVSRKENGNRFTQFDFFWTRQDYHNLLALLATPVVATFHPSAHQAASATDESIHHRRQWRSSGTSDRKSIDHCHQHIT